MDHASRGKRNDIVRDLGAQPLARIMAARRLKPADLVAASGEQLTHKMVSRAAKGRRLTSRAQEKVLRALNNVSGGAYAIGDLFNYQG